MAEPIYITAAQLRTEIGVDVDVLSDVGAVALIQDAEDIIDHLLGGWPTDPTTGRKIVQTSVIAWQWDKLQRSVTKLAAILYANPDLISGERWTSQSGPDFAMSGPIGGVISRSVLLPLDQSNLRRLGGRALPAPGVGRYDSFLTATRHDGT